MTHPAARPAEDLRAVIGCIDLEPLLQAIDPERLVYAVGPARFVKAVLSQMTREQQGEWLRRLFGD